VMVIPWRIERRNVISLVLSIVAVVWWYKRREIKKLRSWVGVKSVGRRRGRSELVLGGETTVNVYLSLTLISTNISAGRADLHTLH
jgi:hypothetical protein